MRNLIKIVAVLLLLSAPMFARARRHFHFHRGPSVMFAAYHGVQQAQNAEIDRLGLERVKNERELSALVERGELVRVTPMDVAVNKDGRVAFAHVLTLAPQLPANRSYVRPWVLDFLMDLSLDFYFEFGVPLQVNSAVRPVTVQRKIRRWNSNAAPVSGEAASAHLSGIAVDLQRRGYTTRQIRWLQMRLLLARSRGDVIVIEEVRHPCFHVAVMGGYPHKLAVDPAVGEPLELLPEPTTQPSDEPACPLLLDDTIFSVLEPFRFWHDLLPLS